jgi:hypothetical protein
LQQQQPATSLQQHRLQAMLDQVQKKVQQEQNAQRQQLVLRQSAKSKKGGKASKQDQQDTGSISVFGSSSNSSSSIGAAVSQSPWLPLRAACFQVDSVSSLHLRHAGKPALAGWEH